MVYFAEHPFSFRPRCISPLSTDILGMFILGVCCAADVVLQHGTALANQLVLFTWVVLTDRILNLYHPVNVRVPVSLVQRAVCLSG